MYDILYSKLDSMYEAYELAEEYGDEEQMKEIAKEIDELSTFLATEFY